jgi:hypothetical protein
MRTLYVALIGVGTLCAGVALGELLARRQLKPYLTLAHMSYGAAYSAYVDVQHFEGTPEAYEAAMMDHIRELKTSANWPTDSYPASLIAFDQVLTYARLSVSQAQRGATQESARSLESAVASCSEFHAKGCTGADILAMVKRLDERHAQKCKVDEPHGR